MIPDHKLFELVCAVSGISIADIMKISHVPRISNPKHAVYYLLKKYNRMENHRIAELFNVGESSVRQALETINGLMELSSEIDMSHPKVQIITEVEKFIPNPNPTKWKPTNKKQSSSLLVSSDVY